MEYRANMMTVLVWSLLWCLIGVFFGWVGMDAYEDYARGKDWPMVASDGVALLLGLFCVVSGLMLLVRMFFIKLRITSDEIGYCSYFREIVIPLDQIDDCIVKKEDYKIHLFWQDGLSDRKTVIRGNLFTNEKLTTNGLYLQISQAIRNKILSSDDR